MHPLEIHLNNSHTDPEEQEEGEGLNDEPEGLNDEPSAIEIFGELFSQAPKTFRDRGGFRAVTRDVEHSIVSSENLQMCP